LYFSDIDVKCELIEIEQWPNNVNNMEDYKKGDNNCGSVLSPKNIPDKVQNKERAQNDILNGKHTVQYFDPSIGK